LAQRTEPAGKLNVTLSTSQIAQDFFVFSVNLCRMGPWRVLDFGGLSARGLLHRLPWAGFRAAGLAGWRSRSDCSTCAGLAVRGQLGSPVGGTSPVGTIT
jgi:hypothetical protein